MYIIDTNTLIYFFKGVGGVPEKLLATPPNDIGIPSIVLYELEYGIAKSISPRRMQIQLKELCSLVEILPFDNKTARLSASIRANLEKQGTPIGPYDILIAGTALANKGILVTNNTREFSRVQALKLDNWYQ